MARMCFWAELSIALIVLFMAGNTISTSPRRSSQIAECTNWEQVIFLKWKLADGTVLDQLSKYVFLGSVKEYSISEYKYNGAELDPQNDGSASFDCNKPGFQDKRNYICIRKNGNLEIRNGSNFENVPKTTEIFVRVRVKTLSKITEHCSYKFIVGYKLTTLSPTTTKEATTTTKIITTTTTSITTTRSTTKKLTTEKLTSTAPPTEKSSTTQLPTTITTTMRPTVDPCAAANLLRENLNMCMPNYTEMQRNFPGLVSQWPFMYYLNSYHGVEIWKLSYVVVRNQHPVLNKGDRLQLRLYAVIGSTMKTLKNVNMRLNDEKTVVWLDKFIPSYVSVVVLKLFKMSKEITVDVNMVSLFISTYDFCSKKSCFGYYNDWMKKHSKGRCASINNDDPVQQFQTCFAVCPSERTISASTNESYWWPMTLGGTEATLSCENGKGNVTRECSQLPNKPSKWRPVEFKMCKTVGERRSEELNQLKGVTFNTRNASDAAQKVQNITKADPRSLQASELVKVTDILEELTLFAADEKVADSILNTVDNCMEASEAQLREGQQERNVSRRMLNLLSNVCGAILKNKTNFTVAKKGFALAGALESKSSFKGVTLSYQAPSAANATSTLSLKRGSSNDPDDTAAMISLPSNLLSSQRKEKNGLIFIAYEHGKLFQEKGASRLNSRVVSAEVVNSSISDLAEPVVTKFKTSNESKENEMIVCAWWDFSLCGGKGGWSTTGCTLQTVDGGYATCHCNHLTNFAVLLGAKPPEEKSANQIILTLISYIGVGISLAGTLFTLISYIIFPKLRDNAPPKILMNLCAALIFLQIVFLIGIERTSPREGCQAVAFLLQYILLCVLSWSGVEGFFSYRGIVMPMKSEVQNLMFKATMFGWVVPLLFPIIGVSVWTSEYGDDRSCAVKGMPLYTTVIAPVAMVMLLNTFSIFSIMAALHKSSKMYPHNAINALHRLRIIAAFVLLFSLTWLFGFFVISNDIVAFQYIFCILNALQGFFVFIFYGVRNENVRKSWRDKFSSYRRRKATTSTSAGTKRTESSFDSVTYNKTDSLRSDSMRKNGSLDSQFKVHLTARSNIYATSP